MVRTKGLPGPLSAKNPAHAGFFIADLYKWRLRSDFHAKRHKSFLSAAAPDLPLHKCHRLVTKLGLNSPCKGIFLHTSEKTKNSNEEKRFPFFKANHPP
ncbi:hypothetical protein ABR855_14385 [Aeromonas hydrophila]|uniref:hypothetical protein n=1 Tax=Aeromonas hydrophila TaxID=644 RepID=UPI0033063DB7